MKLEFTPKTVTEEVKMCTVKIAIIELFNSPKIYYKKDKQLTSKDQVSLKLYNQRFPAKVELMACRCGHLNKYWVAKSLSV